MGLPCAPLRGRWHPGPALLSLVLPCDLGRQSGRSRWKYCQPCCPHRRDPRLQESQTQILKHMCGLSKALWHILAFYMFIVQTTLKQKQKEYHLPSQGSQRFPFPSIPRSLSLSLALPSRGLISLRLLGLGDGAHSAAFPELLQGREWEACQGQHLDRAITVVRGPGQLPAG